LATAAILPEPPGRLTEEVLGRKVERKKSERDNQKRGKKERTKGGCCEKKKKKKKREDEKEKSEEGGLNKRATASELERASPKKGDIASAS
jgi:hypothetical protein